jgi:glucose/arabinose dehydrogenase
MVSGRTKVADTRAGSSKGTNDRAFRALGVFSLVLAAGVLLMACDSPPPGRGGGEVEASPAGDVIFKVETVAAGLQVPWAIAFDPNGRMFFTERPGRIRILENGQLRKEPLLTIPEVNSTGESGLMGLALHPNYNATPFVYVAYSHSGDQVSVRVVRFLERNGTLVEPRVLIDGIPAARYHAGTALGFGPDRKLYITTGDAAERELAQQLDSLAGKTLR